MSDQALVSIITTMLAVFGTIAGTIVGVTLTYRSTQKADEKKVLHEKVEEIYNLTIQVRDWAETWLLRLCQATGINPYSCLADLSRLVYSNEDNENMHFWTLITNPREDTCPIDKVVTLISLYVPSLKEQANKYQQCVFYIENILSVSMVLDKLIEGKTPMNIEPTMEERVEKVVEEITSLDKEATIRQAFNEFRITHIAFQHSLEEVLAHG